MKKQLYLLLILLATLSVSAQTYQWQWAKQGGGNNGNDVYTSTDREENIKAITTDSDGNYYFLTWIFNNSPMVDTTPITTYGRRDLLLYSTNCNGNLRWKTVIGGYSDNENAMKIEVDDNGGIYLMANLVNNVASNSPPNYSPTYLDTNVSLPVITSPVVPPYPYGNAIDPAFKSMYFLKYNTATGNLVWYKALQGDVTLPVGRGDNGLWYMDSNKNVHAILGFYKGTHLEGNLTVPNTYDYDFSLGNNNVGPQYSLVKFNYDNGNMTIAPNPLVLPITGAFSGSYSDGGVKMLYDETLNRYYIAGKRMYGVASFEYSSLSYDGVPFNNEGFIFTFDGNTGNEIWRKEFEFPYIGTGQLRFDKIFDIKIDQNSNIYICGHYSKYSVGNGNGWPTTSTFGGATLPATNLYGTIPFVSKIAPSGNIDWITIPTGNGMNGNNVSNTVEGNFIGGLAINGSELAFTKGAFREIWGNFPIYKPLNARSDPLMVRMNLDTGAVIGIHEIVGNYGTEDQFTAVTVDRDGNYVVGGFFSGELFGDPNDGVNTLTSSSFTGYSQFFIAKLAKSACSAMATTETELDNHISFYPNPTQDEVQVSTKNTPKSWEIYGMTGQIVSKGAFSRGSNRINMSHLATGTYMVKVETEKGTLTGKVLKK